MISTRDPEGALALLSHHYNVEAPELKVGMPKGKSKDMGCYVGKAKTIHVANGEFLFDPHLILHEFYHHLRTHGGKHLGTEKHADKFAIDFIRAYSLTGPSE